ncbi:hypothetical protein HG421_20610 [Xanthomonas campestris pv. badrii]|uniref:Uncharacterized protein n=1 Tax=Xanthomonas campestris pv. badrii TaxID=149696 RepID=A0A7Z2VDY3_XANCA|nr:hypothetical protein [Xanthomonas campestris]MCC4603244.1 hypothetical protein [Xanthomonas campestris pv. parthenii]QJD69850.1 hypothetical protein HG421_20610 [Xanthomonas campestris pv. badrii]
MGDHVVGNYQPCASRRRNFGCGASTLTVAQRGKALDRQRKWPRAIRSKRQAAVRIGKQAVACADPLRSVVKAQPATMRP